jgi:hypothetical protein
VPLGTPVTITVDGFWDGDHNGNQPVIVVPNGQGENKKFHLPHGALVQTKPEEVEVEVVEFTVDKTPKPQPVYYDVEGDEARTFHGRTFKDLGGRLWFEVSLGYVTPAKTREEAEDRYAYSNTDGLGLAYVRANYGPLTDVTDTGEPLDAEPTYTGQCEHREERRCARPSGHAPSNEHDYSRIAQWEADLLEEKDTPRKPEPGDRVRVSYEAEYHEHAEDGHFVRPNDLDFPILTPSDVEITVIEPARPKVPEDPKRDLEEVWHNQNSDEESEVHEYNRHTGLYVGAGGSNTWEHLWTWTQEYGHKLYPLVTTRGPVIGG